MELKDKYYFTFEIQKIKFEDNDFSLKAFLKSYLWLIALLIGFLVLGIAAFSIGIKCDAFDVGDWVTMIASSLTFLGTMLLSIFLYHYSWVTFKTSFIRRKARISSEFIQACDEKYFDYDLNEDESRIILDDGKERVKYYCFEILYINNNDTKILDIIQTIVFIKNKKELISFEIYFSEADSIHPFPVEYKQNIKVCYKIDKDLLIKYFNQNDVPNIYIINLIVDEYSTEYIRVDIIRFNEEDCCLSSFQLLTKDFKKKYGNIERGNFIKKIEKEFES